MGGETGQARGRLAPAAVSTRLWIMSDDDVEAEAAQSSLCPCPNRFIKKPLNMTTIEK